MSGSASPSEVVRALMQGISSGAWDGLHDWYAEDAGIEYPFALPVPTRLEGRQAIRDYFALAALSPLRLRLRDMVVRETADPEVVVAEWTYDGEGADGRAFQVANIQVTRVRDGKILSSRDYHNHFVLTEAMGRLPRLLAALEGGQGRPPRTESPPDP
jgi:ketosteroid isomerase-like protein